MEDEGRVHESAEPETDDVEGHRFKDDPERNSADRNADRAADRHADEPDVEAHRHESGRHESGRHESGRHESGRHSDAS